MKRLLIVIAASMLSTAAMAQADMRAELDTDQHLGMENEVNVSNNGSMEADWDVDTDTTGAVVVEDYDMGIDTMSTASIGGSVDANDMLILGPAAGNYSANIDVEDLHR